MSKSSQSGFTLIELVVVIVILGILAAFAVPRFMGLETEARIAALKSMAGTLRSAATMAHGICMARSCVNGQTLTIEGQDITFANGYPNAATVGRLIQSMDGFTQPAGTPQRFQKTGAREQNNCWVQYDAAAAGGIPNVRFRLAAPANAQAAIEADLRARC
jgi:MSHA pilin protein MshA